MALTQKQLEARKHFIGSSDAMRIANGDHDEWHQLILEKSGDVTPHFDKATLLRMSAGSHLEPWIIKSVNDNLKDYKLPRLIDCSDVEYDLDNNGVPMHSTLDGKIAGRDNVPVEIKAHFGFRDMDELCELYAPQCQHHMIATGEDHCWLVVFFALHCRIEIRKIHADNMWMEMYVQNCHQFWRWYSEGIPPITYNPMPPVIYDDMVNIDMSDLECFDTKMQSEMNGNASMILEAKKATESADISKVEIRHYMPRNAKRMELALTGNHLDGSKLVATRSRSGTISIRIHTPKEDTNASEKS